MESMNKKSWQIILLTLDTRKQRAMSRVNEKIDVFCLQLNIDYFARVSITWCIFIGI